MNGKERAGAALARRPTDRPAVLPILHSGLPPLFGVPLGDYFTSATTMAGVIVRGYRTFGYDGVQLSLGVTGEAEALGARVEQPADGAPILRSHLIPELDDPAALDRALAALRARDAAAGGRLPLYYEAVGRTVDEIGAEAYVLAMLRGPLLAASQLCGVEPLLIATVTHPQAVEQVLDYTVELALALGQWLRGSGAHGLVLGEATCSPNFISPRAYRRLVQPRHRALVAGLKAAGWDDVGLHICGNLVPIFEGVVDTGVTFADIDYQVDAATALRLADGRIALRGNLDPSAVFRFGRPEAVRAATGALIGSVGEARGWILSSGCDIPPGTPADNIHAFVACR